MILSRTVSKLSQIIVQILDTLRCGAPSPFGGVKATCMSYIVHLKLIGKLVMDFLLVLIEIILLGVTAEALQANIVWKSAFLKGFGQFWPNFHVVGDVPREPFSHG